MACDTQYNDGRAREGGWGPSVRYALKRRLDITVFLNHDQGLNQRLYRPLLFDESVKSTVNGHQSLINDLVMVGKKVRIKSLEH